MTANQRRPGFRLPWSDGSGTEADEAAATTQSADASSTATPVAPSQFAPTGHAVRRGSAMTAPDAGPDAAATPSDVDGDAAPSAAHDAAVDGAVRPAPPSEAATPAAAEAEPSEFMRELVAAMRRVADEARESGLAGLKAQADDQVRSLEGESEKRAGDLRSRADADVAGIGEWLASETERVRADAERRVGIRRSELEQQLSAENERAEHEISALRSRVSDYERELAAYHAQLAEINDPAAFAAAAKRIPAAPELDAPMTHDAPSTSDAAAPSLAAAPQAPTLEAGEESHAAADVELAPPTEAAVTPDAAETPVAAVTPDVAEAPDAAGTPSVEPAPAETAAHQAMAPVEPATVEPAQAASNGSEVSTAIVVKGLGSFGAITGFRQSLAAIKGIDSVSLSLGPTGEFVYRATHSAGMDVAAAIVATEGEGVVVEPDPDGTLRVTLGRPR